MMIGPESDPVGIVELFGEQGWWGKQASRVRWCDGASFPQGCVRISNVSGAYAAELVVIDRVELHT